MNKSLAKQIFDLFSANRGTKYTWNEVCEKIESDQTEEVYTTLCELQNPEIFSDKFGNPPILKLAQERFDWKQGINTPLYIWNDAYGQPQQPELFDLKPKRSDYETGKL